MTFAHVPPRLPRPVVFDQFWADLTFLHWAVDPADVAPYLPPGTRPDVFSDGATYVGLVPFLMASAGPGRKLPVPYLGRFLETNIRLYSVDDAGRHGVVFRSLDATRLAVVLLARWGIRIPYQWSSISLSSAGPVRVYRTERRWPRPRVTSEVAVEIGAPTEATPVEEFLTRRWGTPNRHDPWVLHEASLRHLDDGLGAAAGFPLNGAPTLRPLWTPGVRTQFGRPTLI
jgi:uncharacterized protein YqjF (DUF2071 family)